MVGEITDKQRSPHWHESGHRSDLHDSTSAGVRTRGFESGGGYDASPDDAPTVTRHAVEHREVVVLPANSGAPLQAGSGEGVSVNSNPVPNLPDRCEGTTIIVCSGKQPSSNWRTS